MSDTIIDIKNSGGVILDTHNRYCGRNIQVKPVLQSKNVTANGSVVADEGYCGLNSVTVAVPTQKEEEAGTATIITNGTQTFSPTSGKVFSNFTVTTNVPTGVDTSDATAVASDILSGKTAYVKGVKLTGSVETYDGTFVTNAGVIGIDPEFGNNSWATIAKVFKSGQASQFWNVGDTKTITSKSGKQYTIRIADMQAGRYAYADGSRSSNGVLEFVELINLSETKGFQMSTETSTNAGGFASSYMRNTTLPNILADLPDDMQTAMSEVNVLSGTGKGTTSGTSSSANKLFFPAEMEMFDAKHYSIGLEECPLGQFDYYKTHNTDADRIKRDIGSTSGNLYWLRSPSSDKRTYFCVVGRNGSYSDDYADRYLGVSPIFAI